MNESRELSVGLGREEKKKGGTREGGTGLEAGTKGS